MDSSESMRGNTMNGRKSDAFRKVRILVCALALSVITPLLSFCADPDESAFITRFQEAQTLAEKGDAGGAEKAYQTLTQNFSGKAESWFLMGKFLMEAKRFKEAIPYFERGLQINAASETAHLHLARLYLDLEEPEKSLEHLEKLRGIQAQNKTAGANETK